MDEDLLNLLEELSLRASCSEDETKDKDCNSNEGIFTTHRHSRYLSSNYTSSSNVSSPTYEQLEDNSSQEDVELKSAVNSLFHELSTPNPSVTNPHQLSAVGYDKSKLLVALLGNIDLVTCAVKKINHLVSLGKKMEQIYRSYYMDPSVQLNLEEINRLITTFSDLYQSEKYVREVNVSRVYEAYCKKLIHIYETRKGQMNNGYDDSTMMMQ